MTPQSILRIARHIYSSPCYLSVYLDDDGGIVLDVMTIHGGRKLSVSADTMERALLGAAELMDRSAPRRSTPQTSEQTVELLRASLDRPVQPMWAELPKARGGR